MSATSNPNDILPVLISGCPEEYLPAIRYALDEVTVRLGVPVRVSTNPRDGPFRLIYGLPLNGADVPTVPFFSECYRKGGQFIALGTPGLWVPAGSTKGQPVDLIGGVFRLLALIDEHQVAENARDRRGIFRVDALPSSRRDSVAVAMVEHHVAAIRELVETTGSPLRPIPLWPDGRRWAVLVTHDTDALRIAALPEICFNSAKAILRGDPIRSRMVKDGMLLRGSRILDDPLFGFPKWRTAQEAQGICSSFYLYVRRKVFADLNDCRSSVADPRMNWQFLRDMAHAGWEFGLHPPVNAKHDIDEFLLGKRFIEERLERPVFGLRHHYWALDWRNPHLTYRMHVNAGFRYDLSMAWRDAAGFRAGTCMPFRPWDPGRGRGLDMYVVPTAMMDGHVIAGAGGVSGAVDRAAVVLDKIREAGGAAVLDWHTESACDDYCYRGHPAVLNNILQQVRAKGDAWVTTPWALVKHWHGRRRQLTNHIE